VCEHLLQPYHYAHDVPVNPLNPPLCTFPWLDQCSAPYLQSLVDVRPFFGCFLTFDAKCSMSLETDASVGARSKARTLATVALATAEVDSTFYSLHFRMERGGACLASHVYPCHPLSLPSLLFCLFILFHCWCFQCGYQISVDMTHMLLPQILGSSHVCSLSLSLSLSLSH
jgi:hypothetical protein